MNGVEWKAGARERIDRGNQTSIQARERRREKVMHAHYHQVTALFLMVLCGGGSVAAECARVGKGKGMAPYLPANMVPFMCFSAAVAASG
jgi:hypothetical protein